MEKAIESDISRKVVHPDVDGVVINEVPVVDVEVSVTESTVVDAVVDPGVVVVNVDQQGEI